MPTIKQNFSQPVVKSCLTNDFTITLAPGVEIVSQGGILLDASNDLVFAEVTGAVTRTTGIINTEGAINPEFSSSGLHLSVNEIGELQYVSDGTERIFVRYAGVKKSIDVISQELGGQNTFEFFEWEEGTVARNASENVDTRINGLTPSIAKPIYTTQDHALSNYVRNGNFWANDLDLTCISPWNSEAIATRAGTLITPRHFINAAHYQIPKDSIIRFIESDGTVHERTIISKKIDPAYVPYFPDLAIYAMDSDLPASIKPCKVIPSNSKVYMPTIVSANPPSYKPRIPCLALDKEEKGLVFSCWRLSQFSYFSADGDDPDRLAFNETLVGGDSGNPAFMIMDLGSGDELVLVTVWTTPAGGTAFNEQIDTINQLIFDVDTLAGDLTGYRVSEADFSAYTPFGITKNMTITATWDTPQQTYSTLANAQRASGFIICELCKTDTGFIFESGATGTGIGLYAFGENLYLQSGLGNGFGSASNRGEVSWTIPNTYPLRYVIEWVADGTGGSNILKLWINGVEVGTDTIGQSFISGTDGGTIGGVSGAAIVNRGGWTNNADGGLFTGTVVKMDVFLNQIA